MINEAYSLASQASSSERQDSAPERGPSRNIARCILVLVMKFVEKHLSVIIFLLIVLVHLFFFNDFGQIIVMEELQNTIVDGRRLVQFVLYSYSVTYINIKVEVCLQSLIIYWLFLTSLLGLELLLLFWLVHSSNSGFWLTQVGRQVSGIIFTHHIDLFLSLFHFLYQTYLHNMYDFMLCYF